MQRPGTPVTFPHTGLAVMSRQHQLCKKEKKKAHKDSIELSYYLE